MKDIKVSLLKKNIVVKFSEKQVKLPDKIQVKIDNYWDKLIKEGRKYVRGEVFTVTKKEENKNSINILVEKTDYAHYLYCQDIKNLEKCNVRIIHTAVIVETNDNKIVFGKMGKHTSRDGTYQLCGGGIDNDDIVKGNIFDLRHNIKSELLEELGINIKDEKRIKELTLQYFKEGGLTNKMTVIFQLNLNENLKEFSKKYEKFTRELKKEGENPEFDEIVALNKDRKSIFSFFEKHKNNCDEYMYPLFEYISKSISK